MKKKNSVFGKVRSLWIAVSLLASTTAFAETREILIIPNSTAVTEALRTVPYDRYTNLSSEISNYGSADRLEKILLISPEAKTKFLQAFPQIQPINAIEWLNTRIQTIRTIIEKTESQAKLNFAKLPVDEKYGTYYSSTGSYESFGIDRYPGIPYFEGREFSKEFLVVLGGQNDADFAEIQKSFTGLFAQGAEASLRLEEATGKKLGLSILDQLSLSCATPVSYGSGLGETTEFMRETFFRSLALLKPLVDEPKYFTLLRKLGVSEHDITYFVLLSDGATERQFYTQKLRIRYMDVRTVLMQLPGKCQGILSPRFEP